MPTPKHKLLSEQLRGKLVRLKPGSVFPSVRAIMRDHSVSQATVTKALESLCDEGLIEKNAGNGTFVTAEVLRHRKDAAPTLCLALPRWESSLLHAIENCFSAGADSSRYHQEILLFDWKERIPIRRLPQRKIDALMIVPACDILHAEDFEALDALGKPYVIFGRDLKRTDVDFVCADDAFGGALAASHLISLGHRRLAVVISEPFTQPIQDRLKGFTDHAQLSGAEVLTIDCGISVGDFSVEKTYQRMREVLQASGRELGFTALFVTSSEPSLAVMKSLHEAHLAMPRDISIISYNGDTLCAYYHPTLSLVNDPLSLMVESGAELLLRRLGERKVRDRSQLRLRPLLVPMESTGPCAERHPASSHHMSTHKGNRI